MSSRTLTSCAPSRPLGWNLWKSSAEKPRISMSAMASASPNAIWIVVEVVGASELGHASFTSGIRMQMSDDGATVLSGRAVMPSRGQAKRLKYGMIGRSEEGGGGKE